MKVTIEDEFVKAMARYAHDTDIQRLVARIEAYRAKIAALEADVEWHRMGVAARATLKPLTEFVLKVMREDWGCDETVHPHRRIYVTIAAIIAHIEQAQPGGE